MTLALIAQAGLIAALLVSRARRRETEARNSAFLRALPDLMFVQTRGGVYLDYSAKDESVLLVPPSHFLGKSMRDILPPALAARFEDSITRLFAGEEPVVVEYDVPVPSGEVRHFEARLVRCERDKLLSIVRDVTAQKRAESALHEAHVELLRASKLAMLGEFAGSVAHEIAQPLTAMIADSHACLRLLDAQPPDLKEVRHSIHNILTAGRLARDVVHHTRHVFAHGDPGQEPLDLADIVHEVCVMVSSTLRARRVTLDLNLGLGPHRVLGDRVQLRQVILNLISNAIQAMDADDGESMRRLTISATASANGTATLTVSDTGIGLTHVDYQRLFSEPYTTKSDGMGWGLSISRSIVEAHGGRLWAEPNDSGGARFSFSLPLPS